MIRRIKRFPAFDLSVQIKDAAFMGAPQEYQRNWLLNRCMNEFSLDLMSADDAAKGFVTGSEVESMEDRTQAILSDEDIMEDWQIPVMSAMADIVTAQQGSVLEIGFGRGVASQLIQARGVAKHTIIECNDSIVQRFEDWKAQYSDRDIFMEHGLWQDRLPSLGKFDGIFFHTYPLKESDYLEQIAGSTTFAEHFFEHAANHLHEGGVFTYLSNEIDSLSRGHQRALFKHFSSIELSMAENLKLPENVRDQWWSRSMVIVKAVR